MMASMQRCGPSGTSHKGKVTIIFAAHDLITWASSIMAALCDGIGSLNRLMHCNWKSRAD
jgi:hypothetical protein